MATKTQVNAFIKKLGALVQAEYKKRKNAGKKWVLPSVAIAQAALETGWGTSSLMTKANAYFGIKWTKGYKAYNANTREVYDGVDTTINADFRAYDSVEDSVADYFDLITGLSRYSKAVNKTDPKEVITAIKEGGYATDPNYVDSVMSIINQYDLTKYDEVVEETESTTNYKVGDVVTYDRIYTSSTSTKALKPAVTSGKITKVVSGAKNPYLIGNGTGWINEASITTTKSTTTNSNTETIKKGDKVKVLKNIIYGTNKTFKKWYDKYDVLEVDGNRVVIGVGKAVTTAINIENIQKV